jgi:hypothetical protein
VDLALTAAYDELIGPARWKPVSGQRPRRFALDGADPSPVAQAILKGLAMAD